MFVDPFEEIKRIHAQIDRMFSDMFSRSTPAISIREPVMDLIDEGDKFRLVLELPGMEKEDIEVNVTEDTVTVKAQRKEEKEERTGSYFVNERAFSRFYRTVRLPAPVIPENTKATYNNGVLEIVLQKKEAPEQKGVKIKVE